MNRFSSHRRLQCSTASRGCSPSVLDLMPRLYPGVDSPEQRTNAREADLPEFLRDLDRGGLVRARAIDDYLAFDGNALEAFVDFFHVDRACAGNTASRRLGQGG